MSERKPEQPEIPHALRATFDGEVFDPFITCPYEGKGAHRPCLMIEEADCRDDDCEYSELESPMFGHGHPMDECAIQHYVGEAGMEAVEWKGWESGPLLPSLFTVGWAEDDHPVATPYKSGGN